MVNKKNRLFKLLFFSISLLLCLSIFVITSFAQVGYEITDNGNIESLNLLDYNNRLTNKALDNNGNIVNNAYGAYVIDNINLQPNTTYTSNITNGGGLAQFDSNNIFISIIDIINNQTFTTSQNAIFFRMDATPNNTTPMLNKGSSLLDYFPYGNYTNDSLIYGANGFYNNVSKISYSDEGLVYEELDISNAYLYLNNSTLKFKDLLSANGIYNVQQHQTQRQNLEINLINPINFSNYIFYFMFEGAYNIIGGNPSDYYISFSGRGYGSQIFYFNDLNYIEGVGYKLELNNNMFVDTIDFYWNNTEILQCWPLIMSSSEYNLGYQDGNSSGYSKGYGAGYSIGQNDGVNIGYADGYQVGFNEGMETDLTTNGVKTLFNSILSFPVDMIKNVFNFDFMGVNVASVIMFIISIGIVAFVIKKFL